MTAAGYSPKSIVIYVREIRYLAAYYPDLPPQEWKEQQIIDYMLYLQKVHQASRSKCRLFAQSVAFFFRNILKRPYDLPSKLYPRKEFKLPTVLTVEEVKQLLAHCITLKQRCLIELLYSSGIRLEELRLMKMRDIEASQNRIRVNAGKGRKDRFSILSQKCLESLRNYYLKHEVKPKVYLFEGQIAGSPMHARSIQHSVNEVYQKAGLGHKTHKVHALRHSFATHLLDNGVDIHTIKELLGHSKIETTMVYLHLQNRKRNALISPLDALENPPNEIATVEKGKSLL